MGVLHDRFRDWLLEEYAVVLAAQDFFGNLDEISSQEYSGIAEAWDEYCLEEARKIINARLQKEGILKEDGTYNDDWKPEQESSERD